MFRHARISRSLRNALNDTWSEQIGRGILAVLMTAAWCAVLLIVFGGAPSSSGDAKAAVRDFYSVYAKLSPGGLPRGRDLAALRPFMSTRLYRLIVAAVRYDTEYARRHPDEKPPFVDGDFFSSNFEGATRFTIGAAKKQRSAFRVSILFEYADPRAPDKPHRWDDAVIVVKERGRFVVDDVEFLGDWQFGNRGRLSRILMTRND